MELGVTSEYELEVMDLGVFGVRMSYRMSGIASLRFPELNLWNLVFGMWM